MAVESLQEAIERDLKHLFQGYMLKNSRGLERELQIYQQDLPIRVGADEDGPEQDPPEPYIIVQTLGGETPGVDDEELTDMILLICIFDEDPMRQGYRDVLRIIHQIQRFYAAHRITGRRYEVQFPFSWAVNQEDQYPYFFGAVSMKFQGTTIFAEEPSNEEID